MIAITKNPLRVWLTVLVALFLTEAMVMFVIPWLIPAKAPKLVEAIVDAMLLTSVTAPILWFLIVRPLQEASNLRTQFLRDLFASLETDRRRIAHELHDGVGQSLTLLVSGLRTATTKSTDPAIEARCRQLNEIASQALVDVKRLALGLRPSLLDDLGLVPALQRIVSDVRDQSGLDIELCTEQMDDSRLPESVETTLFRITQETLANITRHSKATHASILLSKDSRFIELSIEDNGIGIPSNKLQGSLPGHLGITGMRERAAFVGGKMMISSTNGVGTRLTIRIPAGVIHESNKADADR